MRHRYSITGINAHSSKKQSNIITPNHTFFANKTTIYIIDGIAANIYIITLSIPSHLVEEKAFTAVKNKPKGNNISPAYIVPFTWSELRLS